MADPGFTQMTGETRKDRGTNLNILPNFPQKLHENKKKLDPERACVPGTPLDSSMLSA